MFVKLFFSNCGGCAMFAPGHITGFFSIYKYFDKLKTGSTGAGITVDKGVTLELKEGTGNIFYNGEKVDICAVE